MSRARVWLVTGAHGQLGRELAELLAAGDDRVVLADRAALDVTDPAAVAIGVAAARPDVVVNAAAWTAVDAAEAEPALAAAVNGIAPGLLAAAARDAGARLLHVSTDYVFDGTAREPYRPGDLPAPASVYGRTKLAGERSALAEHPDGTVVVRTAWVYGRHGGNFVRTMLGLEATRDTVEVVDDQRGSPTWARDLAAGLVELGRREDVPAGILHATDAGETTWYGLAREVFTAVGADPDRVRPTTSAAFVRHAPRPAYSVLSGEEWAAVGLTPLPHWRESLAAAAVAGWR